MVSPATIDDKNPSVSPDTADARDVDALVNEFGLALGLVLVVVLDRSILRCAVVEDDEEEEEEEDDLA